MKDSTRDLIRNTIKSKTLSDEDKISFFTEAIKAYEDKISQLEQKESEKIEKTKEILGKLLEYLED